MSDNPINEKNIPETVEQPSGYEVDSHGLSLTIITINGDIGSEPTVYSTKEIDFLQKCNLNMQLYFLSKEEISIAFAGEDNPNLFGDSLFMSWQKYTPKFHLDLTKREGKWLIQTDYKKHKVGEDRDLLDAYELLAASDQHTLIRWLEQYAVIKFSLEYNRSTGDVEIFISSNDKFSLLEDLGYEWEEMEESGYSPVPPGLWGEGWDEDEQK